jgi:CubicO group peptidase (beta-lactamase class C family)
MRRFLPPFLLSLLVAAAPAQDGLSAADVEALAQKAFEAFAPKGLALAVIKDGEPLVELALGERRDGLPATPRSLFNIASCSKAFTAALVAQQVKDGKLRWSDRVVDHVPEFKMQDPWITAHMTVADLLSHRCGLVTFAGDLLWYGSSYSDAEVLARIEKLPIVQGFRDQFGYQNLMYMVAGVVLERTTGRSWEQLVEERITAPLGMSDTRASVQRLPADAERAYPHIDGVQVEEHEFVACKAAASMSSSVHDLTRWMRALLNGGELDDAKILDKAALAELWRPRVTLGGGRSGEDLRDFRSYGMGWFLSIERGKKLVEHDGGMPGFLSKVSLLPADRFGFVVLNNANDGVLNEALKAALLAAHAGEDGMAQIERFAAIGERVHKRDKAEKERREAQRLPDTQPRLDLGEYVGLYTDAVYGSASVELRDGRLEVALLPSKSRLYGPLSHWHHDTFRVDFPDRFLPFALLRFDFDFEGKVAGFRIDCPIADFDFGALDFRRVAAPK